jgi:activator of HSP90 ATPase
LEILKLTGCFLQANMTRRGMKKKAVAARPDTSREHDPASSSGPSVAKATSTPNKPASTSQGSQNELSKVPCPSASIVDEAQIDRPSDELSPPSFDYSVSAGEVSIKVEDFVSNTVDLWEHILT